jgi:hypothetical protein
MLIEIMKKAKSSNHSRLPRKASPRVSPSACGPIALCSDLRAIVEGSLSNNYSNGTAINKTIPPEIAYALRQPN